MTVWHSVATLARQNAPVIRQHVRNAWQYTLKFIHAVVGHAASSANSIMAYLRQHMPVFRQMLARRTAQFRDYLPVLFNAIYARLQSAWQATCGICRLLAANIRRYFPILVQKIASGLSSMTRVLASLLARAGDTSRKLLPALAGLLVLARSRLKTPGRIADSNLGQRSRRFFQFSRRITIHAGERLYQYALLARLHKPIGIYLLLWPTLWALCIAAGGVPDFPLLLIFTGGVVLMRSAGCIVNDLADQDFDAQISRTRLRPLAAGKVTPKEALVVASVLLLCAFLLVLQLNSLTIGLSVIGALLAIVYPFTKRYTYMPQFFLGLTFGWAVPMAFAAQTGTIPVMAWVLLMATVLWALVYDTIYAMMDRAEDIKLGIKSTAILLDDMDRVIIGIIQGLVVLTLLLVGSRLEFNGYYYVSLAIAALLFIYQQYLIRDRVPAQCFKAFLNNNWFGAIVFAGILMNYQFR